MLKTVALGQGDYNSYPDLFSQYLEMTTRWRFKLRVPEKEPIKKNPLAIQNTYQIES